MLYCYEVLAAFHVTWYSPRISGYNDLRYLGFKKEYVMRRLD